eukprot:jgi/Ulvmu1/3377/UM157_0001.1
MNHGLCIDYQSGQIDCGANCTAQFTRTLCYGRRDNLLYLSQQQHALGSASEIPGTNVGARSSSSTPPFGDTRILSCKQNRHSGAVYGPLATGASCSAPSERATIISTLGSSALVVDVIWTREAASSQPLLPPGSVKQAVMADLDSEAAPLELGLGSGNGDASGAVGTGSHELRDSEVTVKVTVAQDAEGKAEAADHVNWCPAPDGAETESHPAGQAAPGEPTNEPIATEEAVAQHRAHFYKHSLRHHAAVVWQQEMQAWTLLALISTLMYGLVVLAHASRTAENNRPDDAPPKDGSPGDASSDSGFIVRHLEIWCNILACVLTVVYFRLMATLMARRKHALSWVDACLTALQQLGNGRTGVIAATAAASVTADAGVSVVVADAPGGVGVPVASAATAAVAHEPVVSHEDEVWARFQRACGPLRGSSRSHIAVDKFTLEKGLMVFGGAVCVCGVGGTLLSSMDLLTEYWILFFGFGWLPANA